MRGNLLHHTSTKVTSCVDCVGVSGKSRYTSMTGPFPMMTDDRSFDDDLENEDPFISPTSHRVGAPLFRGSLVL